MRYRLDAQHYINDRLLEPGHIIGEGTDVPFVDRKGRSMRPSVSMTPLDADAVAEFKRAFPGAEMPERDPTKAIPIHEVHGQVIQPHGVVDTIDSQPGSYVIGPDGKPTKELKKGLPDPGSPNNPVGMPVVGTPSAPGTTPSVPPKPEDPALRVNVPQAEQAAVAAAQKKAQDEARAKVASLPTEPGKK